MKYSFTFLGLAALASAHDFTSIYNVTATPYEVVNSAGESTPGPYGAKGQYNYAIDSKTDTICYDITLEGVVGEYRSPAKTATHIHEGAKGKAGPPRIALPNPVGDDKYRHISGCLTGPFTTGILGPDNVTDTGCGFKLSQIEANPAGFFTDSHTVLYPAGVVRGQLDYKYEIIKPKHDGYPHDPEYPVSTKKEDGHPTKKPEPTKYPEDCTTKKDDGHDYTKKPEHTKYPEYPEYPTTKKDDGHVTKKPEPTKYPEHPEYPTTKKDDGHEYTTATYTKTYEITVSKCKEEVTDCPYKTKPVVTKTYEVYTTVCPKSEVSKHYPQKTDKHDYYTKPVYETKTYYETVTKDHNKYETKTIKSEYPKHTTQTKYETVTITKPGYSTPTYETKTIKTEYPVYETVSYPVHETKINEGVPSKPVETYPVHATTTYAGPIASGTGYPKATPTYEFTGAAGSNKVGGLLVVAGLAAALL
ncbi:hypothetical protein ONS95_008501 [Cadophora gregata]|uniref:uncharacterized protein n=1 Tax=Cadophora gregata TaxID=51156 RepID=UPI0026DBB8B1|nr:uncharacterized protein ONS95_008501 [Cadophora gregata]KAK0100162.1 hypothetical protein ONS95_008501 [Cadophora gregata]